jgi:hypothetical protein
MSTHYILVELDDSNLMTASDYTPADEMWSKPRAIRDAILSWTPFGYADIRTADVTGMVAALAPMKKMLS